VIHFGLFDKDLELREQPSHEKLLGSLSNLEFPKITAIKTISFENATELMVLLGSEDIQHKSLVSIAKVIYYKTSKPG